MKVASKVFNCKMFFKQFWFIVLASRGAAKQAINTTWWQGLNVSERDGGLVARVTRDMTSSGRSHRDFTRMGFWRAVCGAQCGRLLTWNRWSASGAVGHWSSGGWFSKGGWFVNTQGNKYYINLFFSPPPPPPLIQLSFALLRSDSPLTALSR